MKNNTISLFNNEGDNLRLRRLASDSDYFTDKNYITNFEKNLNTNDKS